MLDHPDIAAVSFVGSTPVARYIYETRHRQRQAGPGARRRQEPRAGAARRRRRHGRRRGRRPPPTARPASAAWPSRSPSRSATSPSRLVDAHRRPAAQARVGDGADPDTDMGPLITAEHRDRVAGYVDAGRAGRRHRRRRRPHRPTCPSDGFFLGATLLDHVTPEMTVYTDEIFGPVLSRRAGRHLRRGPRADQRQPVRQRHRHLHPRRRRGPPVPVRRRGRHGRHQRARSRCRSPTTRSAAGRPRCSATPTCTAPRASTSTPAARSSRPLARPGHVRASTSASRGPAELTAQLEDRHTRPCWLLRRTRGAVRRDDRAHVFHSWSAQGLIDPLPIAARRGQPLLGLLGQALPRLLLPAGQRQHRPPAPRWSRRSRSRPAPARPSPGLRQRRAGRGGPADRRARPGRPQPGVLHQRRGHSISGSSSSTTRRKSSTARPATATSGNSTPSSPTL